MDFIDNLLNHMSSKFNQESALPKQAEISMDETFKWRALKNNQFASRSKNSRTKVKSKDKDKHQTHNNCELSPSPDENNKSDGSPDLVAAEVSESAEIEIEIAHDISGAEIQEALASTQGALSVLVEESNDHITVECFNEGDKLISLANDEMDIYATGTCTLNVEIDNEENSKSIDNTDEVAPMQLDTSDGNPQTEETSISRLESEETPINTQQLLPKTNNIFLHMSSTFNATCLTLDPSLEETNNLQSVQTQTQLVNEPEVSSKNNENSENHLDSDGDKPQAQINTLSKNEPDFSSISDAENPRKDDMEDEQQETQSSTGSVRRSTRLQIDHVTGSEQNNVLDPPDPPRLETSPPSLQKSCSISDKEAIEIIGEVDNSDRKNDKGKHIDTVGRVLRNKSIGIKPREVLKSKTKFKKSDDNRVKVRKLNLHQEGIAEKRARSKSGLRTFPKGERVPQLRRDYRTRQTARNVEIKTNRRRSSRFGPSTKKVLNESEKVSNDHKLKNSHESQRELTKNKNHKEHSPKQRPIRLSRDGSDGILASAIARREKNDTTGIQGRLSRPIKLSAKILANDELRYGFELQNNARLNLNSEAKDSSNTCAILKHDPPEPTAEIKEISHVKPKTSQENILLPQPDSVRKKLNWTSSFKSLKTKCRDPLDFIEEVKRDNLGSNKSPECNSKLNKLQQRRLLKLKEKHMFMLGLQRIGNKTTPNQNKNKNYIATEVQIAVIEKEVCTNPPRPLTNQSFTLFDSPPLEDHTKVPTEQDASHVSPLPHIQPETELTCFCQKDTRYFTTKTQCRMYCTAVDEIDGQLIGCRNELIGSLQNLLRPSNSASYQLLCTVHQRRLHHHGSCATCGVFCTQGNFVICKNKHLFHRDCAEKFIINTKEKSSPIIPKLVLKCPHCGLESINQEYVLKLQNNPMMEIVTSRR
ncbi:uncharacterized protein LOC134224950 [Armigeres subalbatus]|uniref:uncharacterized protein LOC134224950 n=1 Tax=Armigeres subalbatus TaxID=124917 RepID=UPI002ED34777